MQEKTVKKQGGKINDDYFFHSNNWVQVKKNMLMNKLRDGLKTEG